MSMPVRCFTCGKVIAQYEDAYNKLLIENGNKGDFFDSIGLKKICCRRMFLGYVDINAQLIRFPSEPQK